MHLPQRLLFPKNMQAAYSKPKQITCVLFLCLLRRQLIWLEQPDMKWSSSNYVHFDCLVGS